MSRAFVREADGSEFEDLPDRPISPHRNLVTEEGLARIDAEISGLRHRLADAQSKGDRAEVARASRDLRYWSQRRASAELVESVGDHALVRFGSRVTIEREDGRRHTYRIVGEDEADPSGGTLSYVSPLAQALIGRRAGDIVQAGRNEAEIIAIEPD
ncbi:transcription elongation factor GreA [Microvirga pudoricolor]|uniref:transcription elongation factor GreA n=1 Tax=Microvirga pudoricolor TaxID=2778729 RepID=UPI0019505F4A|nr:transcription elongation factor GreA [Microvirga pudoricolor]MBM6596558.1 transcription elongation factor GreA [Microvirga pudoricolor]